MRRPFILGYHCLEPFQFLGVRAGLRLAALGCGGLLGIHRAPCCQHHLHAVDMRVHGFDERHVGFRAVHDGKGIYHVGERAAGGIGGHTRQLDDAHLHGSLLHGALAGGREVFVLALAQMVEQRREVGSGHAPAVHGREVLQQVVQPAGLLGLRQRGKVAVFLEQCIHLLCRGGYLGDGKRHRRFGILAHRAPCLVAQRVLLGSRLGGGHGGRCFQRVVEFPVSLLEGLDGGLQAQGVAGLAVGERKFVNFCDDEFLKAEVLLHAERMK